MPTFAASMVVLSVVLWLSSLPVWPFGERYPNCVTARVDTPFVAVGAVSNQGVSSLFVTRENLEPWRHVWQERGDSHFIGFPVPAQPFGLPHGGLMFQASATTIGWDLPYWFMAGVWLGVFAKYFEGWRYRSSDLIYLMTFAAVVTACFQSRCVLPVIVFSNLATALICLAVAWMGVRWFYQASNPLWPLVLGPSYKNDVNAFTKPSPEQTP
ncbi:hypothetical protein [Aeoliella sp. SH292]|uniref:hypothetical protein n=1 Tax=Aeoliella sp. SH292 TaxID=3454464 RepID=UPI003F997507